LSRDSSTSKWQVRVDGKGSIVSCAPEKLALCAQPVNLYLSLRSMDATVTDIFLTTINDHLAVVHDALREMSLWSIVFRQRPFGLRISHGNVIAVSRAARLAGLLPGGRVKAVGELRDGAVNLAHCSLPVALLLEPPSPEVEVSFHIDAFTLQAVRAGVATQRATIRFPEVAQEGWGPGPASVLLRELRERYTQMLLTQSPQFLANLANDIVRDPVGDSIATGISLAQAAVTGISTAVQHHQMRTRQRKTPVTDFDDICDDDDDVVVVTTRAPTKRLLTGGESVANPVPKAAAAGIEAGLAAAAGITRLLSEGPPSGVAKDPCRQQ